MFRYLHSWQGFEKLRSVTFIPDRVLRSYKFHNYHNYLHSSQGFEKLRSVTYIPDRVLRSYMFPYLHSWQGFEKLHVSLPSFLTGFWEGTCSVTFNPEGFEELHAVTFNPDRVLRSYMFCYLQSWQGFGKLHVPLPSFQTGFWEATCSVTFNPDMVLRSYMFHNFLQSW